MKTIFLLSILTLAFVAGCGQGTNSVTEKTNTSSNPLTAPVDYLGAVGRAQQLAVKTVDTTSINSAIQLFQVEHARFPQDLDELVKEKFLTQIPKAPYGSKIVYDPATGKVSVVKL